MENPEQKDIVGEKIEVRQNIKSITTVNGKPYSIRDNRDRFFYPHEWFKLVDSVKPKFKFTLELLMNTGARYNEARNIKAGDFDPERNTIILRVTKVKAKKGEKNPRPRTIVVSNQFARIMRKHIKDHDLKNEDFLGIQAHPSAHLLLKRHMKLIGMTDYYMLSLHNIRKTHGNYLKALGVDMGEICSRLGHDYNTFLKSYVSPDIFNYKDKQDMRLILGDLYAK